MDKRIFLATWKDIPAQNEVQYTIENVQHNAGTAVKLYVFQMKNCDVFHIIA